MLFAFLARLTIILNWRLQRSSRLQQLFIDPLTIQWPLFNPVTIYRSLGWSIWPWGSISTTLRTTALRFVTAQSHQTVCAVKSHSRALATFKIWYCAYIA